MQKYLRNRRKPLLACDLKTNIIFDVDVCFVEKCQFFFKFVNRLRHNIFVLLQNN